MTTNAPAQSRPPPFIPPPPSPFRPPRGQMAVSQQGPPQTPRNGSANTHHLEVDESGRAPKRRKMESPTTTNQAQIFDRPFQHDVTLNTRRSPSPCRLAGIVRELPETDLFGIETDEEYAVSRSPPPLPNRPWKRALSIRPTFEERKCGGRVRKKVPVPNVPDQLESPDSAPKLGKCVGKCALAGFYPWIGKHPEDVLNETTAKHGYYDRTPPQIEKEQNTARVPLQHAFKNRFGLDTLSAIFSAVLEQQNKQGRISSGSTFKPPPRVTLTEARRKTWLEDLANTEISLRKLSRTVPQGIRGQALLDQCLINSVPISRAIWFAKCVGANEIRTQKRNLKGPNGVSAVCPEAKWLKDWTLNIEQFIDAAVRQCGQPGWRSNIQYVLRLCTRLYLDNLLDRDHYLDWMVRSLAVADVKQTPFWLMLLHIYYRDIIRFRRRGKKLAEALLKNISTLRATDQEISLPLIVRIRDFIRKFAATRPMCFLIPDLWPSIRESVRYCLHTESEVDKQLLDHLERINERALGSSRLPETSKLTSCRRMIGNLDAAKTPFNIIAISDSCEDACHDMRGMISTVIKWATTRFRHSTSRIYLAARLLRRWDRRGQNVEQQILEFIGEIEHHPSIDHEQFHHLMLELSRSRTFSISRYMQWLTTRGALRKDSFEPVVSQPQTGNRASVSFSPQKCRDAWQLLTEISTDHLDDHVRHLRNRQLSRAGFDSSREATIVEICRLYLSASLPSIVGELQSPIQDINFQKPEFASLPWSIKSSIAHWLRSEVVAYFKTSRGAKTGESPPSTGTLALDIAEFCVIRATLEQLGDIAVLADVMAVFLTSTQEDILAAVADTVNYQSQAFGAIGAFEDLHQLLCQAYIALKVIRRSSPLLATSLIALCKQYPSKAVSVRTMQVDFLKGDRSRAMAACSPFSDGVAESLQQAGETFFEEFEAILQSESNMNEETMSRLFGVLTERILKIGDENDDHLTGLGLCQLLARLKLHRTLQCNRLLEGWLVRLLSESLSNTITLITYLVATACTSFEVVAQTIKKMISTKPRRWKSTALLSELFSFERIDNGGNPAQYCLDLSRRKYASDHALELLVIATSIKSVLDVELNLTGILPNLISTIVLSGQPLPQGQHSTLIVKGLDLVLLYPGNSADGPVDVSLLAKYVDDISLPYCQARLKLMIEGTHSETSAVEKMANDLFAIADRDVSETGSSNVNCFSLLQGVSAQIAGRVRQTAEESFFASLPPVLQAKSFVSQAIKTPDGHFVTTQKYLTIALGASAGSIASSSTATIPQLIDKFSIFLRALGSSPISSATAASPATQQAPTTAPSLNVANAGGLQTAPSEHLGTLLRYLPLLLQMACLRRLSFSPNANITTSSNKMQHDQVKILVLLVSIALHPALYEGSSVDSPAQSSHSMTYLVSFTLDVAATLVDDLSDEARMLCARFLKDKMRDPRVQFLFGSVNMMGSTMNAEIGAGLQMVKEGRGVVGEWKPRQWEVLEGGAEPWVGLGMFGARKS